MVAFLLNVAPCLKSRRKKVDEKHERKKERDRETEIDGEEYIYRERERERERERVHTGRGVHSIFGAVQSGRIE